MLTEGLSLTPPCGCHIVLGASTLNTVGRRPVTYVILSRNGLIPPELQRRMSHRLDGVDIGPELDACNEVMIERPEEVANILVSISWALAPRT